MNPRSEIEQTTKIIIENMKQVKATTVDYDYYQDGQPGEKPPAFMHYDASEMR